MLSWDWLPGVLRGRGVGGRLAAKEAVSETSCGSAARLYGVSNYDMAISDTPDRTYVLEGGSGVCVGKRTNSATYHPGERGEMPELSPPRVRLMNATLQYPVHRVCYKGITIAIDHTFAVSLSKETLKWHGKLYSGCGLQPLH